jgi:hypothetical protein
VERRASKKSVTAPGHDGAGKGNGAHQQIVVLAMHRSGSSALTALLEKMGAYLGEADAMMPPSASNPRGHFERNDVNAVCVRLLAASRSSWWRISNFLDQGDVRNEGEEAAIAKIVALLDAHGSWAIKDPRLCLTLPAFLPALRNPHLVMVVRHPLEAALSLEARNGLPIALGLALWEAYTISALEHVRSRPHSFVLHEQLIADPVAVAAQLEAELQARGIALPSAREVADVIAPGLVHHRARRADAGALGSTQARLWSDLALGRAGKRTYRLTPEARADLRTLERAHMERLRAARGHASALP